MQTAKITITLDMPIDDYQRIKSENGGKLRAELEKAIIEKMGGEIVVKSLKAEYGEIK